MSLKHHLNFTTLSVQLPLMRYSEDTSSEDTQARSFDGVVATCPVITLALTSLLYTPAITLRLEAQTRSLPYERLAPGPSRNFLRRSPG